MPRSSSATAEDPPLLSLPAEAFAAEVNAWFTECARDLPWRRPGTPAWSVLVSEVMLQQTPVARVLPVYRSWLERWPGPADLAADSPGEAVRMWGKLGYPRRALRLHGCASVIVQRHGGQVPAGLADLLALPGVGEYTARAVQAFAFGKRAAVVDINVRRVLARAVAGQGQPAAPSTTRDLAAMQAVLPQEDRPAALFCGAMMELGAVLCTSGSPNCSPCPVRERCAWRLAGYPPYQGPTARPQRFAGTDRQVRGLLLDVLRGCADPVPAAALDGVVWPDVEQRRRALDTLIADGLVDPLPDGRFALPS
ncbi:MAG TPA: A/G-specific adenine glycosylase [Jatrophihabitans sp.]|jgi:A/G-specific adenine glycosylase|uniref:A/G-specific adenine glycosylase n=1 Tax=Jatrophihabitans sp. TaxID=1932789 RepID=UPI002EEF7E1E